VSNPPNPWQTRLVEWIDAPPVAELEVFLEKAKSILSENTSPDLGFRWSLNPYRGCFHGCSYCYARPSHQYWDFGAGTDFERKIVVKTNAPDALREAFNRPSWGGELVMFSGNTDCYQPLEASYQLTRQCLEICAEFRNPVSLITKGALIRRDLDVLMRLRETASVSVNLSIAFADDEMSRLIEPWAPRPSTRLEALRVLADAGIDVGIAVAPIIPGLNDSQIPELLGRARDAGARRAFRVLLRLPSEVKPVFFDRLQETHPDRVGKVVSAIGQMHDGKLYDSRFGERGKGSGPRWKAIEFLFDSTCRKLGLNARGGMDSEREDVPATFRRPGDQQTLFGGTVPLRAIRKRPRHTSSRSVINPKRRKELEARRA
jgi:DNA repair photolyase